MIGTKFEKPLQLDYIADENGIQIPNPAPNTLSKYEEASKWCNEQGNATIEDKGNYYEVVKIPDPTQEELEEKQLEKAKAERAEAVSKIKVEVDGMIFDGDETAQTRMSRTISAAQALGVPDTETRTWVLADNTVAEPTIAQLAKALKLAGDEQTRLWTVPYEGQETEQLGIPKIGI